MWPGGIPIRCASAVPGLWAGKPALPPDGCYQPLQCHGPHGREGQTGVAAGVPAGNIAALCACCRPGQLMAHGRRRKARCPCRCCKISGRQEGCRHHPQGTVCLRPAAYKRPIMATGLAGGLTKPYKGIRPAAPMRPGLPAHAPVPLDAAQSSPLPQFFLNTPPFDGKGFDGPGHSYKLSGSPAPSGGVRCTKRPAVCLVTDGRPL